LQVTSPGAASQLVTCQCIITNSAALNRTIVWTALDVRESADVASQAAPPQSQQAAK